MLVRVNLRLRGVDGSTGLRLGGVDGRVGLRLGTVDGSTRSAASWLDMLASAVFVVQLIVIAVDSAVDGGVDGLCVYKSDYRR